MSDHPVIIVPGLGDDGRALAVATGFWKKHGLDPYIHVVGWEDEAVPFEGKFQALLERIDRAAKDGQRVSLVGCSAGASAVLNAYAKRKGQVASVVNVCGMIRTSRKEPPHKFMERTRTSTHYRKSVLLFEKHEGMLTREDRGRIMTIRARFGDQHVPRDTVAIEGALNTTVFSVRHIPSIALALTVFSRPLLSFLQERMYL